jgi:hypothetical protein
MGPSGTAELVAKYGKYSLAKQQFQADLAKKTGLTANVYAPLVEGASGSGNALSFEEAINGVPAKERVWAGDRAAMRALTDYDADFYFKTFEAYGAGKIDLDGHIQGNIALENANGGVRARAYEVDLDLVRDVPEDLYFATAIARRIGGPDNFFVLDGEGYLASMAESLMDKVGRSRAIEILEHVRDNFASASFREEVLRLQDRSSVLKDDAGDPIPPDFENPGYMKRTADRVIEAIDALLPKLPKEPTGLTPIRLAVVDRSERRRDLLLAA